jgi:hypothetical protein
MAIQPIDLQTLFTQVDKVGKNQSNQREGLAIQQALQNVQIQKKTEERVHTVNESQDVDQGPERISDRNARRKPGEEARSSSRREGPDGEVPDGDEPLPVIRDPDLGNNIDLCG